MIDRETRQRISWRDSFDTWPSLTIRVELMPWQWRVGLYRDEIEPYFVLSIGPIEVKFSGNRKLFRLERFDV